MEEAESTSGRDRLKRDFEILSVEKLAKSFGGLRAVSDFDLELKAGELVGLIGPNGAGKTTVFNLLTGFYKPTSGVIRFAGYDVHGMPPHRITEYGMARTFQNIRLFGDMTVEDNVKVGFHHRTCYGIADALLRRRAFRDSEAEVAQKTGELLDLFSLADKRGEPARSLPYGEQRRLEIARAMAAGPRLLLLDEPVAGMNRSESRDLMALLRRLRVEFDLTMLLIEHDIKFVMDICERIVVLDGGEIIASGSPAEICSNPAVIEAYLGSGGSTPGGGGMNASR